MEQKLKAPWITAVARQRWWSIGFVTAVIVALWLSDWLRPLGQIGGMEPIRLVNIALTLILAVTGPIQWARTSQRFHHVKWLRNNVFVWTHRLAGMVYIPLIVLWDFVFETENVNTSESAFIEVLNKPVLIVILATSAILFLKWPRPLMRYYTQIKYIHITVAILYVVKFFAEPFMGGKLG